MSETHTKEGFGALNISLSLLQKLDRLGISVPTPIQRQAIPVALQARDLVGIAQTGTGKTLAFGLPMATLLRPGQIGLVLAPTRELAIQIKETLSSLGLRSALLIGGEPIQKQIKQLKGMPQVVVATPGRLIDHLDHRTLDLRRVAIVVLDEADRMLDMGFAPAIKRILAQTPADRQTMLFSATMPPEITDLARHYQRDPVRVEVAKAGTTAENVEQELIVLEHLDKSEMLGDVLKDHNGSVLIFARTRHGARKLAKAVRTFGHSAAEIHSDRTLPQRRAALSGFKSGQYRVLVATDIAARGIDVKEIGLVVNFDVPENPEDYVHRIGRTGRAGASGRAITFATPQQQGDVRDIEKLIKSELRLSPRSRLSFERPRPGGQGPRQAKRGGFRSSVHRHPASGGRGRRQPL